jgi:hypothetical protein
MIPIAVIQVRPQPKPPPKNQRTPLSTFWFTVNRDRAADTRIREQDKGQCTVDHDTLVNPELNRGQRDNEITEDYGTLTVPTESVHKLSSTFGVEIQPSEIEGNNEAKHSI